MSRPICQRGCTMFDNVCYCRCPTGSSPANEDGTKCVPDVPTCAAYAVNAGPSGPYLADDPIFTLSCTKVRRAPESGLCPSGFTEWQSGSCYVNCPSGLIENGLSCLKRPLQRSYMSPHCDSGLYYFNGSDCILSSAGLLFFILFLILLWYVGTKIFLAIGNK
jgi:hypothetical protein